MTAAEYRRLISRLSDALASFRSAVTPNERRQEGMRTLQAADYLHEVAASRFRQHDRDRAARLVATALDALRAAGILTTCRCGKEFVPLENSGRVLCGACLRQQRADANLIRMAFGEEYR